MLDLMKLQQHIRLACDWLTDIAQMKADDFPENTTNKKKLCHMRWKGAIRGEYLADQKQWHFYCPVWHTGQAVKALVAAGTFFNDTKYLASAREGAEFIFANQVWDHASPDHGLILAYEDYGDKVNTSAVLECLDGLMQWATIEKSEPIWDRVIQATRFLVDKCYMPGHGLFRDVYDPQRHSTMLPNPFRTRNNIGGRPLLDDAILLQIYRKTNDKIFINAHLEIAETLVREQNPPGNWIDYGPCNPETGTFHPRQAYWWGRPLIETYHATGRKEFLDTAIASGEFLKKAMRKDGGFFRGTYLDEKTDSFGHATSGSACSALIFMDLFKETGNSEWMDYAEKTLEFCMKVQFTNPKDENLKGAILEKVLAPDGTDRLPYHIRDLGTIFFIQAAVQYLDWVSKSEEPST